MSQSTLGERISLIIATEELTQKQFADAIGLTSPAISKIVKDKCGISGATRMVICQKFNVRPDWLETGEGEMHGDGGEDAESIVPELVNILNSNQTLLKVLKTASERMTVDDWKKLNSFFDELGVK